MRGTLPLDTTRALEARERRRDLAIRALALALITLVLWFATVVWVLRPLAAHPEWMRHLLANPQNPFDVALSCLMDGPCREKVLTPLYQRTFLVPYTLALALSLLPLPVAFVLWLSSLGIHAERLPGSARFMENWRWLLQGISYLGIKNGRMLRYPGDLRFRHTLIVGSTGAGKTSRIIRPMLAATAKEGRSAIVFDLKYPDLGLLEFVRLFERYDRRVMVLLPYDPATPRLPLLKGADDPRVALELAEVIVPVEERETSATFYTNIERQILATLINIEARDGEGSLGNIFRLARRGREALITHVKSRVGNPEELLGFFLDLPPRDQASMVAGLASKLSIFAHPHLDRSTRFGDNELDIAVLGREPTLFYLGIPQLYLMGGVGQLYLQLVKRFIDRRLLEEVERQGGSRLKVPIEFYLDEFTNLGYLPYMPDNLSTMRSRGVATIIAVQSFEQALERYPRASWESIMANCNTKIILGRGLHDTDAKRVSESLGQASYTARSEGSLDPHPFDWTNPWPRAHRRQDVRTVPLLAPEELRNIPPAHALVQISESDPLIAYFPRPDEALAKPLGIPGDFKALARDLMREERALLEIARSAGSEEEPDFLAAARYVVTPYLTPEPDPEAERAEALAEAPDPKEELFTWFLETIRLGTETVAKYAPGTEEITKLSVRPPAGEAPAKASEWQRARWIKVEKAGRVLSLIPPALNDFLERHGDLVQWALVLSAVRNWIKAHPEAPQGEHPWIRMRENGVVVAAELLAELGFDPERLPPLLKPVRVQNRRGYYLVPFSLAHELELEAKA